MSRCRIAETLVLVSLSGSGVALAEVPATVAGVREPATVTGPVDVRATAPATRRVRGPLAGGERSRVSAATFVNWETPHVHPLDVTPDGLTLLAVNTADNRLEVFDLSDGTPRWVRSIPVGLDPVTVRARTNSEAWVVNHVSDSVSIVDLGSAGSAGGVRATLRTLDEPCDVVFAGEAGRGFVSCSQANAVQVFDPADLGAAAVTIPIEGEDPRALAVSPDGSAVYAAVFESGNGSTILGGGLAVSTTLAFPPNVVSDPAGPYGGVNPPPNAGTEFFPALSDDADPPIPVALIVRQDGEGAWRDDNGTDWTALVSGNQAALSGRPVGWTLLDHDVAVIDANGASVTEYRGGLMNICMALGVNPATGRVTVVGTDATNEVRFEPVIQGTFIRVLASSIDPTSADAPVRTDLNPHLDYSGPTIGQGERDRSLGDPRAIAWSADGALGYVTGMGSNNVTVVDSLGNRAGAADTIEVGEGPTGLVVDHARGVLYVLNKFEGSISVVDMALELEVDRVAFFDPTPSTIRAGRKHLYDTHKNSGLGHISCASCHVDGRMDRLAWDLGDPSGAVAPLTDRNLGFGLLGLEPNTTNPPFEEFHPMKGPMATQTLQGIIGLEPLHWRGDRLGLEEFNGAFIGLQGDDSNLTVEEMQEFEDLLASITFPPNPFRNFDNTLPASLALPGHYTTGRFAAAGQPLPNGNAQTGMSLYRNITTRRLDGGAFACVTCHTLPTGAGPDMTRVGSLYQPIPVGPMGEHHLGVVSVDGSSNITIKIPQLRNEYEKTGFNTVTLTSRAGFGVLHDGSVDSLERFVAEPAFTVRSDQEVADLVAFLLAFSGSDLPEGAPNSQLRPPGPPSLDTRAAVGWQTTVLDGTAIPGAQSDLINAMIAQADLGRSGVVVKGRIGDEARGWAYNGTVFQSDRAAESHALAQLLALAAPGSELTFTVVPTQSATRIGVDRDGDGFFDGDEVAVCSDPANPLVFPGGAFSMDFDGDLDIDQSDYDGFVAAFFALDLSADWNTDGVVDAFDYDDYVSAYFGGC